MSFRFSLLALTEGMRKRASNSSTNLSPFFS
jgi:hypothetical protein